MERISYMVSGVAGNISQAFNYAELYRFYRINLL
jgi:hypothetical protein